MQEILYVLERRGLGDEAVLLARQVLRMFHEMLEVEPREMERACDLIEVTPGLPPRDAVHAATMTTQGVTAIITADEHFVQLPHLRRIAPADA